MATVLSSRINKIIIALSALILLSILSAIFISYIISVYHRQRLLNQMPVVTLPPTPPMPSPNAYDYYLKSQEKLLAAARTVMYAGKPLGQVWMFSESFIVPLAEKELAITVTKEYPF